MIYPRIFSKDLFVFIADFFKEHIEKNDIKGPFLTEQTDDETDKTKMLQYFQNSDTVVGSCGLKDESHKCVPDYYHTVGNDNGTYKRLQKFCETSLVSHMARVIYNVESSTHKFVCSCRVHVTDIFSRKCIVSGMKLKLCTNNKGTYSL